MEIILLERVPKLGELGEKVRVKPGFGRNYLIPKKKGLPATKLNLERFEAHRAELEEAAKQRLQETKARASAIEGLKVIIAANSGEEGKLFGSIGTHEIVEAVMELGHEITKSEVQLPNGPIRQLGDYEIELRFLGDEVTVKILLSVTSA